MFLAFHMAGFLPPPRWMRPVLLTAGAYNLIWGTFTIFFPAALFDWLAIARPNYPALWQCIAMIVGVYGIGYGIAAFHPARHWPIVLVGLLGKVLGPLGALQAVLTGALPAGFLWLNAANDVIWWVPFVLVLRYAWKQNAREARAEGLPDEETLLQETRTSTGPTLAELSREHPTLLVFLRHAGCTFCREAMAELAVRRPAMEAKGARLALVHMGTPEAFAVFAARYGLGDVPAVADPARRLYQGLGLRRGTLKQVMGWQVVRRGTGAFFAHGLGIPHGDTLQLPGVFLLRDGHVVRRYFHQTSADKPDYVALCEVPALP